MLPIRKTHYFDGLCYRPLSKWPKRIKVVISILLLVLSCTYVQEKNSVYAQKYTHELKLPYIEAVQKVNPDLKFKEAREIVVSAINWGTKLNIDPTLLLSIAKVESSYDPHAISPTGAFGLMQVIPSWHRDKIKEAKKLIGNPELFAINTSIYLGARVVQECLGRSGGNLEKALSCYSGNTPGYPAKVLAEQKIIKKISA